MSSETKVRTKKSANFALELLEGEISSDGHLVWAELQDGFVSPKKALDFIKEKKFQGVFRVVRVVTPVYGGSVVQQEPIYTLKRIDTEDKGPKVRKTRVAKVKITEGKVEGMVHAVVASKEGANAEIQPPIPVAIPVPVPPAVEKPALPPEVF